jgi:CO/xanthine dehydrogenase FAD-binding subunit
VIVEYLRPNTLDEAIQYLQRKEPVTLPLGGGNVLSKYQEAPVAVVDLQNLGLKQIIRENGKIEIGASVSLSEFETFMHNVVFSNALRIQAGKNQRNTGTVAGLVCMADGRSTLLTLLLTLDAQLNWQPSDKLISLGNWLPKRYDWHDATLITQITIPEITIRFESIARTPKDRPIVIVAMAKWHSGRMRVVVGGCGPYPILAMDGNSRDNAELAVDQAFYNSDDQWASSSYRREVGKKLASRMVVELNQPIEEG